jgi:hypothetical protein
VLKITAPTEPTPEVLRVVQGFFATAEQHGDVLVVECPPAMRAELRAELAESLRDFSPAVVVLPHGFHVLRVEAAPDITAELLWQVHREVLGGRSSITGAPLPETLADCAPGPQGAHYALALATAIAHGASYPQPPPGVTEEEAERIRGVVERVLGLGTRTTLPQVTPDNNDLAEL